MPIDISLEELLPLRSVPGRFPGLGRNGKPIHHASVYRWATIGCRGVCLETVSVGGSKATSVEAIERFVERLSNPSRPSEPADAEAARVRQRRSSRQRQRAAEKANRELAAIGA